MASNALSVPTASITIDNQSPYYLHNGDHHGLLLVSQILIGDDFQTWSRFMLIVLEAKNMVGFVDGTIPRLFVE
jgi:hypothetical protein